MNQRQVLVVEDNPEIQAVISELLKSDYSVLNAFTLAQAEEILSKNTPDLVLLDVVLPDGDGFRFLSKIKSLPIYEGLPVIFLTGQNSADDKVHGFTLGAEDYITKPFDHRELRLRVSARFKAMGRHKKVQSTLVAGPLMIQLETQQASLREGEKETPLNLSPTEFKLLKFFLKHKESVLSRQQLIDAVWGSHIHVLDRTIDAHVSRLRKKLEGSGCEIRTAYGSGYAFRLHAKTIPPQSRAA